jgi:hypothetical protein
MIMRTTVIRFWMLILFGTSMSIGAWAQFSGGGTGTEQDPFRIKTADDLNNVRNYIGSGHSDKHFRLMNDIDLTAFLENYSEGWLPIGDNNNTFTGYFHGGGYQINGLWINRTTLNYVGLFAYNSGTIDSLAIVVSEKNIAGGLYVGGLVGYNTNTVFQCNVIGGEVKSNSSSSYSGGLIGRSTGTVTNCYATGASFSSSYYSSSSGGLIGYSTGAVMNCYATGASTASNSSSSYSGGLVGYSTGTITNCYATGVSSSSSNSSSSTYSSYSYSGGLVGYSMGTVNNCYATGASSSSSPSYSYSYSGGFVGYIAGSKISDCYSIGNVTSDGYKGGFAGYCGSESYLFQCYFNSDLAGVLVGVGSGAGNQQVLGMNTAGMKLKNTYVNWDFYETWGIKENTSYPYLYNNLPTDISDIISGKGIVCINSTQTYTADTGKSNYVWTVTNGNITSGQSTNKVTVKWNNNTNDGKINVSYGTIQISRDIKLTSLPQPSISGNMKPNTGTTHSYSTEAGMSDYVWTVTSGEILSGQGTKQVSVKWDCSFTAGHIKVNYTNANGCSAIVATDSTITKQYTPPSISGATNPFAGSNISYSTESGKTDYTWEVTGGNIVSGQGTRQISVKWDCTASIGHVKVNYASNEDCYAAVPTDSLITLKTLPAYPISGNQTTYVGHSEEYSISNTASNYTWSVSGGDILSGQGTKSVTVLWKKTSGKIEVDYTNEYGCPDQSELTVKPVQLFGGGSGSASDPYIIYTPTQLSFVFMSPNSHYRLANDIDLTDFLTNSGIGWIPISNFTGVFHGGLFTVKGLWIYLPDNDELGLFGSNLGTIDSLKVEIDGRGIYGNNSIGGLVGNNRGTISQCSVTEGSITAKGNNIGGLVGSNYQGTIIQSYSANTAIWGINQVGGLVGYNEYLSRINQCYAVNIVVGSTHIGGLIGEMYYSTCSQSYSAGYVEGGNYTGGFLGYNSSGGTITGCYYDEETSEQYDGLGNPDNSQYNNIKAKYTNDMMKQNTFVAWDFNNVWKIDEIESYPYFQWQDIVPVPLLPSAINRVQKDAIRVYPNPTDGIVYVNCEINTPVRVYGVSGKLLYQTLSRSEKETIDLGAYPKGIYLIKAGDRQAKIIKK